MIIETHQRQSSSIFAIQRQSTTTIGPSLQFNGNRQQKSSIGKFPLRNSTAIFNRNCQRHSSSLFAVQRHLTTAIVVSLCDSTAIGNSNWSFFAIQRQSSTATTISPSLQFNGNRQRQSAMEIGKFPLRNSTATSRFDRYMPWRLPYD